MSRNRERFKSDELATCLSHYDLGVVTSVREFHRGSRRSPKLIIESDRGKFLFKRRARGRDDVAKVAFTHQLQMSLADRNFPLAHLVRTRPDNNSMLVLGSGIYEMFEFVEGTGYDGSLESTDDSGRTLGLYHKLLSDFHSDYTPPTGSYHDAETIHQAIRTTVSSLPLEARPPAEVITSTVQTLEETYRSCARKAEEIGLGDWRPRIVHGDWHPGNMLFRERRVVAVIDHDAARLQQSVIDLANGTLQFSIRGGGKDLSAWPDYLDESRFKRFIRGYDSSNVISKAEIEAIPYLMCEAMIAEAVLPIAATGSFGRMQGFPFLQMVERKVRWILSHLDELYAVMKD